MAAVKVVNLSVCGNMLSKFINVKGDDVDGLSQPAICSMKMVPSVLPSMPAIDPSASMPVECSLDLNVVSGKFATNTALTKNSIFFYNILKVDDYMAVLN